MFRCLRTCLWGRIIHKSLHLSPTICQKQNPVYEKLLTEFTNVSYIVDAVNQEEVKNIGYKEWKNRILLLKQYGFQDADCFKMISLYPPLLKIPESNLKSNLQQWINAEFGTKNFQLIFISNPHLLEIDHSVVRKRLPILKTYFRTFTAFTQMIVNCPNIIHEDWNQLSAKINYLIKENGYKMGDLLQSCALSKDLNFIKLRFYVVIKCGVFKQQHLIPHEENKHKKLAQKNPELKCIIQDSDEKFAKLVAKITLEEYLAAKDLFFEENYGDNSEYENDDDDDDDDEKNFKKIH